MAPHVWVCAAILPAGAVERQLLSAGTSGECGLLPLPEGEGWGEGLQTSDSLVPPHPHPLPVGEREYRRAAPEVVPHKTGRCGWRQHWRTNELSTARSRSLPAGCDGSAAPWRSRSRAT